MKKGTKIILFVIIILIIGGLLAYGKISKRDHKANTQQDNLTINNESLNEIENADMDKDINTTISDVENNDNVESIKFNNSKMKIKSNGVEYTETEEINKNNYGIKIEINNGKAYITTNVNDELYKSIFTNATPFNKKEITGFKTNIISSYQANIGNGINAPIILFIMENGTVEYINTTDVIQNKKYVSNGILEGIKDIVKFASVDVKEIEGGGYISVVAIDKNGYSYDINEILQEY